MLKYYYWDILKLGRHLLLLDMLALVSMAPVSTSSFFNIYNNFTSKMFFFSAIPWTVNKLTSELIRYISISWYSDSTALWSFYIHELLVNELDIEERRWCPYIDIFLSFCPWHVIHTGSVRNQILFAFSHS